MEDKEYYDKLIELFKEDILQEEWEQGNIGYFDDIEYDFDETLDFILEGKNVNSNQFGKALTDLKIELYRETINRNG